MREISLLDCTLRDGGCVNDFNFGENYMNQIFDGVQKSGVEIIECGYIDENKGSVSGRTQFIDDVAINNSLLIRKETNAQYVAMIDYGKFDVTKLQPRSESTIDGIRLAFHKKNRIDMIAWAKIIVSKGYDVYIQPMLVMRYSDRELIDLIDMINQELPNAAAFYIVDSFGEMRTADLNRVANLVDHNLVESMPVGFHSHNNLQLSYSNAMSLLDFPTHRDLIFDVSILGMGKGAGNLNAEIFAEHLNLYYGKEYKISAMLEVIDNVLNQIRQEHTWGYSIEYYLSSINHCTPSYAGYFYSKHTLTIDDLAVLLGMIEESKKISFDRDYARQLYFDYVGKKVDDSHTITQLKEKLQKRYVILAAPGKSLLGNIEQIKKEKEERQAIVISVNHVLPEIADIVFATKKNIYEMANQEKMAVISTSNVTSNEKEWIINYNRFNKIQGEEVDISIVILLNLLAELGIISVGMAGFDGFTIDMEQNYYSEQLMRPITKELAEQRNKLVRQAIDLQKENMRFDFLTPSIYQ